MSKRKKYINSNPSLISVWEAVIIVILAFVAYGNTIQNDYNIDDAYIVPLDSQNDIIKEGISAIPTLLTSRYNQGEGVTYGYRPMGKITMVFEYMWWGNNPHNSHVVNILLYALNIILLLVFLRMLSIIGIHMSKQVIYIGLLLFIFHPIHTEVVASIKNREEILCFTFLIMALIFYLNYLKTKRHILLVPFAMALLLSMLSKEMAFNIFGWVLLLSITWHRQLSEKINLKKIFKRSLPFIGLAIVLFFIVFVKLTSSLEADDIGFNFEQNPYKEYSSLLSVPNGMQTVFFYLKRLVVPAPLLFYYGYDMLPVQNWSMILPYLGILLLVLIVVFIIQRFRSDNPFILPFWLCAFLISIFPASNILYGIYVTGIVGERLVYQASFAFCIIIASLFYYLINRIKQLESRKSKNRAMTFTIGPVLLVFLFLTVQRNTFWEDKRTLYEHDIKFLSNSARANFMMANHYMKTINEVSTIDKKQQVNNAKHYFVKAIKVYPDYSDAKIKLAFIYANYLGKPDSAIYYLATVKDDASQYHLTSLELLGDLYTKEFHDERMAVAYYQNYFEMDSLNERVYQKMMNIYFKFGAFQEIIQTAEVAMQNEWVVGYVDMGDALFNNDEIERAIHYYNVAIEKGYNDPKLIEKVNQIIHNK